MNDSRQLELATSPVATESLDAETAAMREGWLALGQAVDAANGAFDADAALVKLRDSLEMENRVTLGQPAGADKSLSYSGFLLAAALVVLAAFAIGILQRPQNGSIGALAERSDNDATNTIATAAGPWSDQLDADLNAAVLRIQEVSWQPTSLDASLIELDGRVVELSSDITGESL